AVDELAPSLLRQAALLLREQRERLRPRHRERPLELGLTLLRLALEERGQPLLRLGRPLRERRLARHRVHPRTLARARARRRAARRPPRAHAAPTRAPRRDRTRRALPAGRHVARPSR